MNHERPKRLRHSASDYCFRLVKSNAPSTRSLGRNTQALNAHKSGRAVSSNVTRTVPVVQATEPGAEFEDETRRLAPPKPGVKENTHDGVQKLQEHNTGAPPFEAREPMPDVEPRRFHLTKPLSRSSAYNGQLRHEYAANPSQPSKLALFVERQAEKEQDVNEEQHTEGTTGSMPDTEMEIIGVTPRKKRPKANAAEKRFQESQKKVQSEIDARKATMPESPLPEEADNGNSYGEPSKRAQRILLDMAREDQGLSDMSQLKKALEDNGMEIDGEADYVYETYIRVPRSELLKFNDIAGQVRSFGILVIEEEDQQLWETYAEAEEDEWDDEDEDSNGEPNNLCSTASANTFSRG